VTGVINSPIVRELVRIRKDLVHFDVCWRELVIGEVIGKHRVSFGEAWPLKRVHVVDGLSNVKEMFQ